MDLGLMQTCGDVALTTAGCPFLFRIQCILLGVLQSSDFERELGTGVLEEESRE